MLLTKNNVALKDMISTLRRFAKGRKMKISVEKTVLVFNRDRNEKKGKLEMGKQKNRRGKEF